MKHRANIVFILLAAALFAAPQIAHDVLSMKSALGQRVRGEIVRAFLSLNESDDNAPSRTSPLLASFVREIDEAQQAAKAVKAPCRQTSTQQKDAPAQATTHEQSAMLLDPSSVTLTAKAEARGTGAKAIAGKAAELPRQNGDVRELAMLVPPEAVIDLPSLAGDSAAAWRDAKTAEQFKKASEMQERVAFITTSFGRRQELKIENGVWLQRLGYSLRGSDFEHAAEGRTKVRVRINRRSAKKGGDSHMDAPHVPVAAFAPPARAFALPVSVGE